LPLMINVKFNIMNKFKYIIELIKKNTLTRLYIAGALLLIGGILANYHISGNYIMVLGAIILTIHVLAYIGYAWIWLPIREFLEKYDKH
jgi:hypothetical protein